MIQMNKQHELTINISPQSRTNIITNTKFFSMDIKTGKKVINFRLDNEPLDLTDAVVMLGFEFVAAGTSKIIDSKDGSVVIEEVEAGRCSVMLPNHLYEYEGQVLVHVYIMFDDGRSLDCGVIVTEFEESWLDQELDEMADFYVKRFEDLANEIRERADYLQGKLDSLQTQADATQDQITSGELVTRSVHEAHVNDTDNPHQVSIGQIPNLEDELINRSLMNHIHDNVTETVAGFMSEGDKTKLNGIEDGANHFIHPTGDGNLHVPATETSNSGRFLSAGGVAGSLSWARVNWGDITGTPSSFTPDYHTHNASDINAGVLDIARMPTGTTSTTIALGDHPHTISQITNLQAELASKAHVDHTHPIPPDPPPQTTITGNAGSATRLQTARQINGVNFDGSRDITITSDPNPHHHAINQITNLQTELDNRLSTAGGTINGNVTINGQATVSEQITSGNVIINGRGTDGTLNRNSITNANNRLHIRGGSLGANSQVNTGIRLINGGRTDSSTSPGIWHFTISNTNTGLPSVSCPMILNRTSGLGTNLRMNTEGVLMFVTSTRKNKLAIEYNTDIVLAKKVLNLDIASWFDRQNSENYAKFLTMQMDGQVDDIDDAEVDPIERAYGLIAEDLVDAGLEMFTQKDADGEVNGIQYDRLWTLLIPLMREQQGKIEALETKIESMVVRDWGEINLNVANGFSTGQTPLKACRAGNIVHIYGTFSFSDAVGNIDIINGSAQCSSVPETHAPRATRIIVCQVTDRLMANITVLSSGEVWVGRLRDIENMSVNPLTTLNVSLSYIV